MYFVSGTDREQERFELPPVPPAGVFDARFASQSMVALENTNIVLSSATYPVEVQWNIVEPGDYALVVDGKDSPLNSAGSTRIAHPSSQIALKIGAATELPKEFALSQNYPNPFNPTTKIRFALPVASRVVAEMYSILGQKVATLINEDREAGYYVVEWNGRGDNGQTLGSGVFLLRLTAHGSEGQEFSETRKLMLLK